MTTPSTTATTTARTTQGSRANQRRVAAATLVGTTIEWYDFFIYATIAGLVFRDLFFAPAGAGFAQVVTFASVGISFLFRPLGAFLAGHYGDKLGRRVILVVTLVMMGGATTLIGVLPTHQSIGLAAPLLLLVLRVLQGISAGGEWGGAVLMAVEHAEPRRRGLAGAFPQLGVPLGMLLATGVTALMTGIVSPGEAFVEWGWRVPFLGSIVLIVLGYLVRIAVDESPIFQEIAEAKERESVPVVELFRRYWALVVLAALVFVGNNAVGYMSTGGFIPAYATGEGVGMEPTAVLVAMTFGAAVWFCSTLGAGILSDRIGRKPTYQIGYAWLALTVFPLFWLIDTGEIGMLYLALFLVCIGTGLTYGPQAALYSELFPASVRFSGVSISYAIGAILGGAFAPMIAQALLERTGGSTAISAYLLVTVVLAFAAVSLVRDRRGIDLSIRNQAEQETGATVFGPARPRHERVSA
ncbi:MFS transporter [Citricoccus sp. SGAir0253]|uniref:MFS transporter n=1 Tax=Citricoccus sp. SGAir0253 TaxID=2567881 RepID=UPI0010CCC068|nr:MFS transporter [Citricoccus sp. SGAir0253]QCU78702.1 MFS transporter [Citricoccus sp. SGAir0253]